MAFVGQALANHILSQGCVGKARSAFWPLLDRAVWWMLFVDSSSLDLWLSNIACDLADDQWLKRTHWGVSPWMLLSIWPVFPWMAEKMISSVAVWNYATMTLLDICKKQTEIDRTQTLYWWFAIALAVLWHSCWFGQRWYSRWNLRMSYGAHKIVGEVMINELSPRGLGWNGRSLRLPWCIGSPSSENGQFRLF